MIWFYAILMVLTAYLLGAIPVAIYEYRTPWPPSDYRVLKAVLSFGVGLGWPYLLWLKWR